MPRATTYSDIAASLIWAESLRKQGDPMPAHLPFNSIYAHGFVRVAVATPCVEVATPAVNAARTLALARQAADAHAALVLFPELGIAAYSNEDLAQQDALLDGVEATVERLIEASVALAPLLIAGAPVRAEQKLFNCALVIHRGRLLGIVPKTYLPNYREFYEKRQYSAAGQALSQEAEIAGRRAPFGNDLLFAAVNRPDFVLHVEICEDVWVPLPPSSYAALGGATILANLSASNITSAKAEYRRLLCSSQSAKCLAAYLYAGAGYGESTTDLAWDGHALICENGELLAESPRLSYESQIIQADIDLDRLRQERMRMTSFGDCVQCHREQLGRLRRIEFELDVPAGSVALERDVPRFPYVPAEPQHLAERCREIYHIQVQALARRMEATGIRKAVIGVSGGLDSAQALIVAVRAVDQLGLPRANVLAYTLPGLTSGERSRENAWRLMQALGVTAEEIDVRPSVMQMLRDIDHPYAHGEKRFDVCFENVQAGERTSHLFRLANRHDALVVGTSDLSELALGYTTYGVGDQMAHYAVNASVPKTLVQHLVRWAAASGEFDAAVREALIGIADSVMTAELTPSESAGGPPPAEDVVGPYALQDFNLYFISRFGFRPSKVAFLAWHAWSRLDRGHWPETVPQSERRAYDLTTIRRWLEVFLQRFFATSQFKRSALPNGPKIGSGGSLSPRSDWRAPSDAHADAWLAELARHLPADDVREGDSS
jgi:NAD+ synthase (glutamine-hydrolysing)